MEPLTAAELSLHQHLHDDSSLEGSSSEVSDIPTDIFSRECSPHDRGVFTASLEMFVCERNGLFFRGLEALVLAGVCWQGTLWVSGFGARGSGLGVRVSGLGLRC